MDKHTEREKKKLPPQKSRFTIVSSDSGEKRSAMKHRKNHIQFEGEGRKDKKHGNEANQHLVIVLAH